MIKELYKKTYNIDIDICECIILDIIVCFSLFLAQKINRTLFFIYYRIRSKYLYNNRLG